jgi:hypothetical protein
VVGEGVGGERGCPLVVSEDVCGEQGRPWWARASVMSWGLRCDWANLPHGGRQRERERWVWGERDREREREVER